MRKYYKQNGNGAICATVDISFPQTGFGLYDFPEDFDFSKQSNYEIIDGVLCEIPANKRNAITAAEAKTRPLTAEEVTAMVIAQQINTLAVDDNTAVRMMTFYPAWAAGIAYTDSAGRGVGYKVQRSGKLWRLRQAHTAQVGWEPENVPSLWEQVNETHDGTMDDPIPYSGNLALESGKHYYQGGEIYRCVRDSINPVYHALSDLVGHYVEVATL